MNPTQTIWFDQPAAKWEEALPVGNGRLGGMVYGTPYTELIQMNEDSVWYGGPMDRNNPSALENLPEIRRLILEGRIEEAQNLCTFALSGTPEEMRHYEPLANLYLLFDGGRDEITDYRRSLDLENAMVQVAFCRGGVRYTRQVIASYPDGIMAVRLTANQPGSIHFHTQLGRNHPSWNLNPWETEIWRHSDFNKYVDRSQAVSQDTTLITAQCGGKGAVELCCAVRVVAQGGTVKTIGNSVMVSGADSATVLVAADTTYREENPEITVLARLEKAAQYSWQELLNRHRADYQELYSRVQLALPQDDSPSASLPTPARLDAFREKQQDNGLVTLLYHFGRYLLIASSRPGALPANLQGLWNVDMNPCWGSKYTININAEMNYWHAETCNLSQCHLPLMDHIERLRENGRKTARVMYGCGGFMAHHNTDLWGDTAPQDACMSSTVWVMGAAWLCLHIWEHYQFTGDEAFLREKLPTMLEAAQFLLDFLMEDGEYLVTCPTSSPENAYRLPNGQEGVICKGASMDNQIIRELFTACIKAAEVLGVQDSFTDRLARTLQRIAPICIGKHGQIMEWNEDYDEIDPGHRHISQLFALHPGTQITPGGTPELAQAARKTLERRLSHGGGHTGWSRAWIINMWARLHDGDAALDNVHALLSKSTLPNLFDNHPPFQIDGNFGVTAGVTEMLLQSHDGCIHLLPALPSQWNSGSVQGLRARGGITVEIQWQNGQLTNACLTADRDCTVSVRYRNQTVRMELKAGVQTLINERLA